MIPYLSSLLVRWSVCVSYGYWWCIVTCCCSGSDRFLVETFFVFSLSAGGHGFWSLRFFGVTCSLNGLINLSLNGVLNSSQLCAYIRMKFVYRSPNFQFLFLKNIESCANIYLYARFTKLQYLRSNTCIYN